MRRQSSVISAAAGLGLAMFLAGCPDQPQQRKAPLDPTGSGIADQLDPVQPAPPAQPPEQPAAAPPAAPAFVMDNTVLQDKKALLAQNPNLIEVENRIKVSDPITAISKSYFNIASRAQMLSLQHTLNAYKAYHEKNPPFKEFQEMYTQAGAKLAGVYRWQSYAYDEETGELCILEDREMKKREYEAAGVKLPE